MVITWSVTGAKRLPVSDALDPPPDIKSHTYHLSCFAAGTSDERRSHLYHTQGSNNLPSSHAALIVTKLSPRAPLPLQPLLKPVLESCLTRSAQRGGCAPTTSGQLAQISSLRHGLLATSVGFRQSKSSKTLLINHLSRSLSVWQRTPGQGRGGKSRSCAAAHGPRCRGAVHCVFGMARALATSCWAWEPWCGCETGLQEDGDNGAFYSGNAWTKHGHLASAPAVYWQPAKYLSPGLFCKLQENWDKLKNMFIHILFSHRKYNIIIAFHF